MTARNCLPVGCTNWNRWLKAVKPTENGRVITARMAKWRVVRASASEAVDLGRIPSRVKPLTSKLVFTASLLDALHHGSL